MAVVRIAVPIPSIALRSMHITMKTHLDAIKFMNLHTTQAENHHLWPADLRAMIVCTWSLNHVWVCWCQELIDLLETRRGHACKIPCSQWNNVDILTLESRFEWLIIMEHSQLINFIDLVKKVLCIYTFIICLGLHACLPVSQYTSPCCRLSTARYS